jgi:hypothetical protein
MMKKLRTVRENKNDQRVFMGKTEGKRPARRPGIDGRIILKWILGKYGIRM